MYLISLLLVEQSQREIVAHHLITHVILHACCLVLEQSVQRFFGVLMRVRRCSRAGRSIRTEQHSH